MNRIWKKLLGSQEYRDAYVAAHLSNTVAAQIAFLREREGWTQKELAQKAGMHQSRISALEDPNYENIEIATLRRLASAFEVGLTVRFVPFSEIIAWAGSSSPDKLAPPAIKDDGYPSFQAVGSGQLSIGSFATATVDCGFSPMWTLPSDDDQLVLRVPTIESGTTSVHAMSGVAQKVS